MDPSMQGSGMLNKCKGDSQSSFSIERATYFFQKESICKRGQSKFVFLDTISRAQAGAESFWRMDTFGAERLTSSAGVLWALRPLLLALPSAKRNGENF